MTQTHKKKKNKYALYLVPLFLNIPDTRSNFYIYTYDPALARSYIYELTYAN